MAPLPLTESPELTIEQSEETRDLLRNTLGITKIATSHTIQKLKKQKTQKDQIDYMGNFVHDAIIALIDEYRNQSFAKFGLEIAVYPPKSAEHIVHPFGTFGEVIIGYVSYSFRHLHNEEPTKKLPVRITRGTRSCVFLSFVAACVRIPRRCRHGQNEGATSPYPVRPTIPLVAQ
jgi:hypothetical protein